MNMREAGWPDRYVRGAIWIEFKVLDCFGVDNGTEAEQRAKMTDLERSGDHVFYCARCGDRVVCAPWRDVRGVNLSTLPSYAYHDARDLDHIVSYVIEGYIADGDAEKGRAEQVSAVVEASA